MSEVELWCRRWCSNGVLVVVELWCRRWSSGGRSTIIEMGSGGSAFVFVFFCYNFFLTKC